MDETHTLFYNYDNNNYAFKESSFRFSHGWHDNNTRMSESCTSHYRHNKKKHALSLIEI